jgi:hypothetical protein
VNYAKRPWWSRIPPVLLTHPFELALSVALLAPPVRGLLSGLVTPTLDNTLPEAPLIAYQLISGIAGLAIMVGLLSREKWKPGRTVERAGMFIASGAFGGYAWVLILNLGWSAFVNIVLVGIFSIACVLRGLAIQLAQVLEFRALRYANRGIDDKDIDG